jgi:hypothetical protein
VELFFGGLTGHQFIRTTNGLSGPVLSQQPLIHGEKFSFKPTPNLEFGFSVTTLFCGSGFACDGSAILRSYSISNALAGTADDPGDRRSGFDFRYRIPKLRKWLVLYNDALAEDESNPIGYWRRSAMNPGIYMPQIPKLRNIDLRLEGIYTDLPGLRGTGVYYFNTRYLDGFTNAGNIMGSPIGRMGFGWSARSTYWHNGKDQISLFYRHEQVNRDFIQGGHQTDVGASFVWQIKPKELTANGGFQYERWSFPALPRAQDSNVALFLRMTYRFSRQSR